MQSLLGNLCYALLRNLCYAIFAMHSLLCNLCYAIFAMQSLLCNFPSRAIGLSAMLPCMLDLVHIHTWRDKVPCMFAVAGLPGATSDNGKKRISDPLTTRQVRTPKCKHCLGNIHPYIHIRIYTYMYIYIYIYIETDISPLHHLPSTIYHSPSSFPPSCPSAPALPYPALRPSLPSYPALPPPSPPGGLGFLRELLIGAKSTKMGGVPRDLWPVFFFLACFILKNCHQTQY